MNHVNDHKNHDEMSWDTNEVKNWKLASKNWELKISNVWIVELFAKNGRHEGLSFFFD